MCLQAAGAIHTDFERGFICAEVMAYDVLHELKTESEVKSAGKYRQEGKNYVVQVSHPDLPATQACLEGTLAIAYKCAFAAHRTPCVAGLW